MNTHDVQLITQLRDCFTAGYTMPQFCIDNGITKPLFILYLDQDWTYFWDIHVQFMHEKRLSASFATVQNGGTVTMSPNTLFGELKMESLHKIENYDFDKIIVLSAEKAKIHLEDVIYLDELVEKFIIHTYIDIPFSHFLNRHKEIKLFLTNFTILQPNKNNSENEKKILSENMPLAKIAEILKNDESGNIETPYDFLGYTNKEVAELLGVRNTKTNLDGSTVLEDIPEPPHCIINGQRLVPDQPQKFKNRIYILGGCSHYGTGAPFEKTIPGYLQKFLNNKKLPYRVENVSQFFTYRYQDIFYNLEKLPLKKNDIVFVFFDNFLSPNLPAFDVSHTFDRPHNYGEVFVDTEHVNEIGYKVLAEKFFLFLTQNNFFQNIEFKYPEPTPPPHRYGIVKENFSFSNSASNMLELEEYKKKIPVGAIVMNCNPFTLGHEYLVEYASKKVKKLYVFVVEEDKSDFPFIDRFNLVQAGVKKFSNVEVLPSGKFIISQQTFSGYFNKESLQDVQIDSSKDVEIFAKEIAPTLGITIRFVGEEPEDSVTRQYNETMKNILPNYGVELCEIPRLMFGDKVISAKKVREALKVGDFDTIKKTCTENHVEVSS